MGGQGKAVKTSRKGNVLRRRPLQPGVVLLAIEPDLLLQKDPRSSYESVPGRVKRSKIAATHRVSWVFSPPAPATAVGCPSRSVDRDR